MDQITNLQASSHTALLYPPRDNPYGFHGMEGGFHGMEGGFHGMEGGFHRMADGFHGLSRWIPYCLSQTSCHLKIPYKTCM